MRHRLWTTITVLCGLLAATQFSPAQELTPEQEARILQRFPQPDRDGDGELSPKEIEPLRERLEKAQKKRKERTKQTAAKPKGPTPTYADLQYGDHKNAVMDVWLASHDEMADPKNPDPGAAPVHSSFRRRADRHASDL